MACGRAALGSDPRLSGVSDLLGELRVARDVGSLDDASLESLLRAAVREPGLELPESAWRAA